MAKSLDPTVYAVAQHLAGDLPTALRLQRQIWTDRLAAQLQQAYEDWLADAEAAAQGERAENRL
jgi:hypothetical protein